MTEGYIGNNHDLGYYSSVTASYVQELIKPQPPVLYPFERHIFFTGNARQRTGGNGSTINWNPDMVGTCCTVSGSRMAFLEHNNGFGNDVTVLDKVGETLTFRKFLTGSTLGGSNNFGETLHTQGKQGKHIHIYDRYVLVSDISEVQNPAQSNYSRGVAYIYASRSQGSGGDANDGWVRTRFYDTNNSDKNVGNTYYGSAFMMTDDWLAVGAKGEHVLIDPASYPDTGAPNFSRQCGGVYIYDIKNVDFLSTSDGTGSFDGGNYAQYITSSFSNNQSKIHFGKQIAYDRKNEIMTIGARTFCEVFKSSSAEGWHLVQTLTQEEYTAYDNGSFFGQTVSACEDFLIVGAPSDRPVGAGQGQLEGSATIFKWDGSQYVRNVCLTGSVQAINNRYHYFGDAVALASSSFGYYAAVNENFFFTGSDPDGEGQGAYGQKYNGHVLLYKYRDGTNDWMLHDGSEGHRGAKYRLTSSTFLGPAQSYAAAYGSALELWSDGDKGLKLIAGSEDMIPQSPPAGTQYRVELDPSYYTGWALAGATPTRHDGRGVVTIHEISQSVTYVTEIVGTAPPMKKAARGSFNVRGQTPNNRTDTFLGEQKS